MKDRIAPVTKNARSLNLKYSFRRKASQSAKRRFIKQLRLDSACAA
jgi:hypothetical protein